MFDNLEFKDIPGNINDKEIKMLALSTCGFCKRAKAFLKENEVAYSYIDVDTLEKEVRLKIRKEFMQKHERPITYPTLLIGDKDFLVGFIRASWIQTLELGDV